MTPVQHFLNLTDDLICVLDGTGLVHDANGNWKNLFHIGPEQEVSFLDLIHHDHRHHIVNFFQDPRRNVMRQPECRFIDHKGKSYWLDLKIRRIPNQNRYWCLLKDITLKKHMFSVLDQISDNCNLGHWEYFSATNTVKWSLKIFDLMEMDPITFVPTLDNMHLFFPEKELNQFRRAMVEQSDFDCTMPIIKEAASNRWVRIRGIKEEYPDGNYSIKGILQDVSKEKQKEIVQLSNNIELSSFEKGLDQFSIVARTDAKGRIIHANDEFCRISKYTEEELLGKDHRLLNSGHHPKSFFKEMWECIHSGRNWRGEIKNKAKDGSYYWVDTIIIPIRDNEGVLKEILSFRFEITNLKKAQEQNQILRNKLELLMKNCTTPTWSFDFVSQTMDWDKQMFQLFNNERDLRPSLETIMCLLTDSARRDFEIFLKSSLQSGYEFTANVNSQETIFKIRVIRNLLGEAIRMDGICLQKKGPEFPGPLTENLFLEN